MSKLKTFLTFFKDGTIGVTRHIGRLENFECFDRVLSEAEIKKLI
jgi:hypothetical protein